MHRTLHASKGNVLEQRSYQRVQLLSAEDGRGGRKMVVQKSILEAHLENNVGTYEQVRGGARDPNGRPSGRAGPRSRACGDGPRLPACLRASRGPRSLCCRHQVVARKGPGPRGGPWPGAPPSLVPLQSSSCSHAPSLTKVKNEVFIQQLLTPRQCRSLGLVPMLGAFLQGA